MYPIQTEFIHQPTQSYAGEQFFRQLANPVRRYTNLLSQLINYYSPYLKTAASIPIAYKVAKTSYKKALRAERDAARTEKLIQSLPVQLRDAARNLDKDELEELVEKEREQLLAQLYEHGVDTWKKVPIEKFTTEQLEKILNQVIRDEQEKTEETIEVEDPGVTTQTAARQPTSEEVFTSRDVKRAREEAAAAASAEARRAAKRVISKIIAFKKKYSQFLPLFDDDAADNIINKDVYQTTGRLRDNYNEYVYRTLKGIKTKIEDVYVGEYGKTPPKKIKELEESRRLIMLPHKWPEADALPDVIKAMFKQIYAEYTTLRDTAKIANINFDDVSIHS